MTRPRYSACSQRLSCCSTARRSCHPISLAACTPAAGYGQHALVEKGESDQGVFEGCPRLLLGSRGSSGTLQPVCCSTDGWLSLPMS